ncbi:hypothetical protein S83_055110 [Arachis hypogaea]
MNIFSLIRHQFTLPVQTRAPSPSIRRRYSSLLQGFSPSIRRRSSLVHRCHSSPRSPSLDYADPKRKGNFLGKVFLAAGLIALCIIMIKQSPSLSSTSPFAIREPGVTHVLVTGGAGYIGSHATLRLLKENYRVTIVDNLSRGNMGAVRVLQNLFPEPGRLQFIYADLGDQTSVNKIFLENKFDAVMHFAAVAYVGESTEDPLKIRNCLSQLYAKDITPDDKQELDEALQQEIDEELLQEVVNMGFDRNQLVESLCNKIQNEVCALHSLLSCLLDYGAGDDLFKELWRLCRAINVARTYRTRFEADEEPEISQIQSSVEQDI